MRIFLLLNCEDFFCEAPQIFSLNDELDYNRLSKIADEFEIDFIVKGNGKEFLRNQMNQ